MATLVVAIALVAASAGSAFASSAEVASATSTPDWTHGSFAGSFTWDTCNGEHPCYWLPIATAQSNLEPCSGEDALYNSPTVRGVWNGGAQTANGTLPFNVSNTLILQGVFGQHLCLYAVYKSWFVEPLCVSQYEVIRQFDEENHLPPPKKSLAESCPPEEHTEFQTLASKLFSVDTPAPPVPPTAPEVNLPKAVAPPTPAEIGAQLTPSGKAAKIGALVKAGGFSEPFTALEAGTVTISWFQVPAGAKVSAKAKAKPALVATGKRTFAGSGSGAVKIRLTSAGKSLLKHAKQIKLTAQGRFTPDGAPTVSSLRVFTLRH